MPHPSSPEPALHRIGTLARASGISLESIRRYERDGLIPAAKRGANGYRYFPPESLDALRLIRHCRHLGFSLERIRELLRLMHQEGAACEDIDRLVSRQRQEIERRIADLQALSDVLGAIDGACPGDGSVEECRTLRSLFDQP